MKIKISIILLAVSLLFISCGNTLSQDGTGSVSVDAGAVVKNAGRHAINNIFLDKRDDLPDDFGDDYGDGKGDGKGDDAIPPEAMPKITTELVVRVFTEGDYAASAEDSYSLDFNYDDYYDDTNPDGKGSDGYTGVNPYDELYAKVRGTNLTIDEIPVGSNISVGAELLQRSTIDYTAFIQWLRETYPEMTDEDLKMMQEMYGFGFENYEDVIMHGYSEPFVVQSGENPVTIKMFYNYSDAGDRGKEGKGETDGHGDDGHGKEEHGGEGLSDGSGSGGGQGGNGGSSQEEDDSSVNVILYNNVNGSTESTDHTIYSFDMEFTNTNMTATNANVLAALDEYTLLDYVKDGTGNFHYLVRDSSNEDYIKTVKTDTTTSSDHVAGNSYNMYDTKLAIDPATGIFFYGGIDDHNFYIDTFPEYTGSDNKFNMSAIDNDYSKLLDFTVSLGEPSVVKNEGITTTTYSNAVAYIAMLKDSGDPSTGRNNDIFFIENPFTYTITDDGINVTTAFNMSSPTSPVIYLSQISFNFPYNNYFGASYSVTDMIIHNGYLYSLLSLTDGAGPYDEGSGDGGFSYSLYSYGALVKIKLDDFSISGVTIYGYDDSNCKNFGGIEATDSKTINFSAYQPASVNAPYFFGPKKFVAIKPKELIIADDGYFYYMDGSDFCHKNVDRLVVYNEDNNELKAYVFNSSNVIKFDNHADSDTQLEILGTGGAYRNPRIYAQCKYRQ